MRNSSHPPTSNTLAGKLQLSVKKSQVLLSVITPSCIHLVGCMQALLLKLRDFFSPFAQNMRQGAPHTQVSLTVSAEAEWPAVVSFRQWDVFCLLDAQDANTPPQVFSKDYFSLSVTQAGSDCLLCKAGALTTSGSDIFVIHIQSIFVLEQEDIRSLNSTITDSETYGVSIKFRSLWPR